MPPHRRLVAWIYTGPLGHLYGTSVDVVAAWGHWGASVARERLGYSKR